LGENPGLMNDPAFDDQSSSLIKLNNGTILYLREVCSFLALVCILREDNFEKQSELQNVKHFFLLNIKKICLFLNFILFSRNYRL